MGISLVVGVAARPDPEKPDQECHIASDWADLCKNKYDERGDQAKERLTG